MSLNADTVVYLQVGANPPIRFAELSDDKNQVCLKKNTLSLARLWKSGKILRVCVPYPTRPLASLSLEMGRRSSIFFRIPLALVCDNL